MKKMVFVFGSNTAGIHRAGAARVAIEQHGAILGKGAGRQGNSYAIPTKGAIVRNNRQSVGRPLPILEIKASVDEFIEHATQQDSEFFMVTQIGCGLAGFRAAQMAPLFKQAPENCFFDTEWETYLPGKNFWGTY